MTKLTKNQIQIAALISQDGLMTMEDAKDITLAAARQLRINRNDPEAIAEIMHDYLMLTPEYAPYVIG